MDKRETNGAFDGADQAVLLRFQGLTTRCRLLRLTTALAVIGLPAWAVRPEAGNVAEDLEVTEKGRTVFAGEAAFKSVINTGTEFLCEMTLKSASQVPTPPEGAETAPGGGTMSGLFGAVDGLHKISREFKLVIADMESFLRELHKWAEKEEHKLRLAPSGPSIRAERDLLEEASAGVNRVLDALWQQFESVAGAVPAPARALHRRYVRERLHPWILCSPFAFRSFNKPLGYSGDFEIVRMITGEPWEGTSLFAKLVNAWLLRQAPAEAHRNRLTYLSQTLTNESLRVIREGRSLRVFNLGCGPAIEVQSFLRDSAAARNASFKLVDFSQDALAYLRRTLELVAAATPHQATVILEKQSVQHLIKESLRSAKSSVRPQYDLVYCAGLFDYLPDETCHHVMELLYRLVAADGLLLVTNVYDNGTFLQSMDCLLDWQLICRSARELARLGPTDADKDGVRSDVTGANVIFEARKPKYA
jgi:extracellular factor (EF) 3-hydroxypalmitic acid methyl ester biosynthesis protein